MELSCNLLRMPQVEVKNGRKKSAIYAAIAADLFPKPVKLGRTLNVWPEHEIDAINRAIVAGKSDDEIRKLVKKLESVRQSL